MKSTETFYWGTPWFYKKTHRRRAMDYFKPTVEIIQLSQSDILTTSLEREDIWGTLSDDGNGGGLS